MTPSDVLTASAPRTGRAPQVLTIPLDHGPRAAGTARRRVRTLLTARGWHDDHIADAQLVVSELVTNALCHALPPVTLHLTLHTTPPDTDRTGTLHIRVTDGGPDPHHPDNRPPDEHGRGTDIITTLTTHHGTTHNSHWATLPG